MKCTNNRYLRILFVSILSAVVLTGCSLTRYSLPYGAEALSSGRSIQTAPAFANDLCVTQPEENHIDLTISGSSLAGLFNVTQKETLYAKGAYDQCAPASLTKVMTAYVALKYGNSSQIITATTNVRITEQGAQLLGIEKGDKMTLSQALHYLLIYSANDVAIMIAENIAGSVNEFVTMMNNEALSLGATGSHFMNPHGLQADGHFVTVYDMYLIFHAAMQYQEFVDIINMPAYSATYKDEGGNDVEAEVRTTNLYFQERYAVPEGLRVIGGKTGTTNAAGHCLILMVKDVRDETYIAVVMRASDTETLYREMTAMLSKIGN